jgi:hypothetical protein
VLDPIIVAPSSSGPDPLVLLVVDHGVGEPDGVEVVHDYGGLAKRAVSVLA